MSRDSEALRSASATSSEAVSAAPGRRPLRSAASSATVPAVRAAEHGAHEPAASQQSLRCDASAAETAHEAAESQQSQRPSRLQASNGLATPPPARPPVWSQLPPGGQQVLELICFCFQSLLSHLRRQPAPPYPASADPLYRAPIFVTWLKRADRRGKSAELELRGCIGCLEPVAFCSGLSEYALRSSMQDRRFPPVRLDELPALSCRLSILYQFEQAAHALDWQVGVHGVLINFLDTQGRHFSATYLPEVPLEHGMTRDVALRELVAKSGYQGPCDPELIARIQLTRYRTYVEGIAYSDYVCFTGTDPHDGLSTLDFSDQLQLP